MKKPTPTPEEIAGIECRFAVYCPPPKHSGIYDDLHVVKEMIHTKDGQLVPNLRLIKNFKREIYVTRKGYQKHSDKKEWEYLDRVVPLKTTQADLIRTASRALDWPGFKGDLRMLAKSPYLYGTDILSTAVVKRYYQDKHPELLTPYSVACFDTETDVVHGHKEIVMATLSFGAKVVTAIHKNFVQGHANVEERLQVMLRKYLGQMESQGKDGETIITDFVTKRGIQWEVVLVDSEVEIIKTCFKRAHEWQPDFVAVWNIDFDMPKMLTALEKAGVDPKDVFSDPRVPRAFRHFYYSQGPKKKVTASGKETPIKPAAQWHTVYCPSSFYFIDAMCAYRHIRTGEAEEPSYALDAILNKHLGLRKLKFSMADGLTKIDWHIFMQSKYPLEYVIYNVFDCVSMEELDEETKDLRLTLPMFSGCSDFETFKSQPRRRADDLHFFCLQHGRVIGSTSKEMADEFDDYTLGLEGWIVTLPAHLVVDNGLQVIKEAPHLRTNIRGHVGDLDVSASYPNGGCVFNISKETTHKELCRINGVPELMQRMQGINLSGGPTNATEFCTSLYGLPQMDTLLEAFKKTIN